MKASRFLNPFQKKAVRTMIIVYLFSLFQLPILVHAQTPVLPVLTQIEDTTDSGTDNPSPPSEEITGAMCQMPEEKEAIECDGTSMLVQGFQMITCNESCGVKEYVTIPLNKIDEITYCIKDKTCGQAIKDFCNGLLDTKINQGPRTVQVVKSVSCGEEEIINNDEEFDDSVGGHGIPDVVDEELEPGTLLYNDYSCCSATINGEKPLGQAVETYSFTCNSGCKNPGRTVAFNQKFKADNNCNTPEECQLAISSACNYCGVEFDGEDIAIDSTFDPLRPEIGKTVADYIAENITRMNMIAGLFKDAQETGTFTISNGVKQLLGEDNYIKMFGGAKALFDENGNPLLDENGKQLFGEATNGLLDDAVKMGQYAMLAINLINGDYTQFAQSAVNLVLTALGSPISLDIQGFLDNPVTAYIKMGLQALNLIVPGLGTAAAFIFDMLQMIPAVGEFFHGLGEGVKKIRRGVQKFFGYKPRNKTFSCDSSCGSPNAGKEMKLADIEEATGCSGAENCADEMFNYCQGNPLVHKSQLIENCHDCTTKILNAAGNELIKGERERDNFMNMKYQCSGEGCGEEPGVIITAEQLHSMYNCSETELKKKCKAEGRGNEDECYQACIEEASQKYCLGMGGDFVATAECTAIHDKSRGDDEFYCSEGCGLREKTEIMEDYLIDKYNCNDITSCLYYAKIECMNPGYAKNKDESIKIAETTKFCVADLFEPNLGSNYYKCASVCVNLHEEKNVSYFEEKFRCNGRGCQKYADERCGDDRTESTCRLTEGGGKYNCELGCKKTPNTIITKSYLQTNYNCQGADCKTLGQQFCEGTLPEPACNVGKGGDGTAFVADHYLCGAGCQKPEHLQVMKRDLAKQLGCNEDGREGCRQTAIDYCDNKHPEISISDKSRIGVIVDKVGEIISAASVVVGGLQSVFDGFGGLYQLPKRALQTTTYLKKIQGAISLYGQGINIASNLYQVITSDRGNRSEVISNLYIIENFEGSIEQFISSYKDLTFKADENAVEGMCVVGVGNLSTKEKVGFLGKIVKGMVVITQVFAPEAMKKLQETLNPFGGPGGTGGPGGDGGPGGSTNPYVNAGVVPYGATCPELDEIIASTGGPSHSAAPETYGYKIDNAASCETKQSLLDAYCEKTLPANYKAEKENDIIKIIRTDIASDDLVCSDPFRRDCNPFEQGDEFLVEIYEPVIVPDNDPVKAPGNCRDGIQNHGETGLDCGEVCGTCCDGSRLGCREKVAGSVQFSCGSFTDGDSCSSAGCQRFYDTSDPDSRVHDYYCTGTPQICNFSDKASCGTDNNCLRGCESDLPPKPGN